MPEPTKSTGLPPWAVIAALAVVVILGLTWTARRRAERKPSSLDDQLNALNARVIQRQHEQQAKVKVGARSTAGEPISSELEALARQALEQCSFFSEPIRFEVPKEIRKSSYADLVTKQPLIAGLVRLRFIDLDPPLNIAMPNDFIEVSPTTQMRGTMMVIDDGSSLRFDAGRRKLGELRGGASTSRMNLAFEWSYETPIVEELTDYKGRSGNATLELDAGGAWRVREATVFTRERQRVCP